MEKWEEMTSLGNFKAEKLMENYPNYLLEHFVFPVGGVI